MTATASQLDSPAGLAVAPDGSVYVSDTGNNRVVQIKNGTTNVVVAGQTAGARTYGNLITNPRAESPVVTTGQIPGWDSLWPASGWSAVAAAPGGVEPLDGEHYFRANIGESAELDQAFYIGDYATSIAAHTQWFTFSGFVRSLSSETNADAARIEIQFEDAGTYLIAPDFYDSGQIQNRDEWQLLTATALAPTNARFVRIRLAATHHSGTDNDAYFDGLSFRALPNNTTGVGDGGPALNAILASPRGLAFDQTGSLYIADTYNNRVRKVTQPGTATASITTVAGTGVLGAGVSTSPTGCALALPAGVAVDALGNLYIADFLNHVIREVTNPGLSVGVVSTAAGTIGVSGAPGLCYPSGVTVGDQVADQPWFTDRCNFVRQIGGPLIASGFGLADALEPPPGGPFGLWRRPGALAWQHAGVGVGSVFVADLSNHAVRHLDSRGATQTVSYLALQQPSAVAADNSASNSTALPIYVADQESNVVYRLDCANVDRCSPLATACGYTPSASIDDGKVCTADACWWANGDVTHNQFADGFPCRDGNACNGTDVCLGGACNHPNPLSNGDSCSDGNLCNGNELCNASHVCQAGTAANVDDGNPCTVDSCDTATGSISHSLNPGATCAAGSCVAGVATLPGKCDSAGACIAGSVVACGAYACGPAACRQACTSDADCGSTSRCDHTQGVGGLFACVPRAISYATCTADAQCQSNNCAAGQCCDANAAVDPLSASPIDPMGQRDFVAQVAPLYSGSAPTQIVSAGQPVAQQVAVIRGRVLTEAGAPLPCAKVSVVGSPTLGSTLTRADGAYSIGVNGGAPVTIRIEVSGYLSADRKVSTRWHDYALAQDVVLLRPPAASDANLVHSTSTDITTIAGDSETDGASTHTARVLVPPGTTATVASTSTVLQDFNVLVKETTNLSRYGRDAMPASLPPTSAFTYAVTLSVKNHENEKITLNHPVAFYVENFVGITSNGEYVPVGYYDTDKAQWVASEIDDGKIFTVYAKDPATGEAQLDLDAIAGAETYAAADAAGINHDERLKLGATYQPGTSLIRFSTSHFSSWDANWGWGPPDNAIPPSPPPPKLPPCKCCGSGAPSAVGSIIDCEKRGLREEVPIAGTPFNLYYSSRRQQGGQPPLNIPVANASLPPGVTGIELEVYIAGRKFAYSWPATVALPLSYDFYWDGLDAAGRKLFGAQAVTTRVGFTYPGTYQRTTRFGYNGNGAISASTERFDATLWRESTALMDTWDSDAQQTGLGGWDIDVHHGYDPASRTLHLGTGDEQPILSGVSAMQTIAASFDGPSGSLPPLKMPTFAGGFDGRPRTTGLVVDADGTVYFVASGNIGRISRDKFLPGGTRKADLIYGSFSAGGGQPPRLQDPAGMAMGPDHKLYVCDTAHNRIVRVDPITGSGEVFAGNGATSPNVDGPALTSGLSAPYGIAVSADGTVYFTEGETPIFDVTGRIRRIRDGQVTTLVSLNDTRYASSIVVSNDGVVYYSLTRDSGYGAVYRIGLNSPTPSLYAGAAASSPYVDGTPYGMPGSFSGNIAG